MVSPRSIAMRTGRALRRLLPFRVPAACAATLCCAVAAVVLLWPMDTARYLTLDTSGEILDRSGRLLRPFLNAGEQWCFPRELEQISPALIQATLATEDKRFYAHHGVDPRAVLRAAAQNLRGRRVVSGASTLTMQVVKQTGPPSRSLPGKALQTVQAVRLDLRLDKDTILETYLNSAPYGQNLVGCEAAARRYFGKPAAELTLPEAALLAGLPKAPTALMPLSHPRRALARRNHVLWRMRDEGFISEAERAAAAAAPLGARRHEFPMLSPHLATRLEPLLEGHRRLHTTLDFDTQSMVERIVRETLRYYPDNITNAAVVVIDVESGSYLARVGSGDFFDTPDGGQVDACRAPRSPGSALKPFIYALAMERNRLYPCESLYDGALDYGRYSPENFDKLFRGLVPASDALQMSLNVPAVTVLERVGAGAFTEMLPRLGVTTVTMAPEHYGLGLTLGTCEVRLEELAAAYCAVAALGESRPIRAHELEPVLEPQRVLSRGAAVMLFHMLEQTPPGEFERELVPAGGAAPRVCWKTGTSNGYRDAWTFMFNRHYVVGVWMGNNNGAASKWLVGSVVALPLATRIFRGLEPRNAPAWPESGDSLRRVSVCAVSGLPASPWCANTRNALIPSSQYLHRGCDMHHPVRGAETGSGRVLERWPGAARGWDLAAIRTPFVRTDADRPETKVRADALRITNPSDKAVYILTGERNGDRVRLSASTDKRESLHWYLNSRYVGRSAPDAPLLLDLAPGMHTLTCMTQQGAIDTVTFEVSRPDAPPRFRG